jgi:hypothetical protein
MEKGAQHSRCGADIAGAWEVRAYFSIRKQGHLRSQKVCELGNDCQQVNSRRARAARALLHSRYS